MGTNISKEAKEFYIVRSEGHSRWKKLKKDQANKEKTTQTIETCFCALDTRNRSAVDSKQV